MAEHQIRWKRSDYITLGKAISQFNKKINQLNAEEKKLYLPDILTYEEEKELITTRKQLNEVVKDLKSFLKDGAEEVTTVESGEKITVWEKKVREKESKRGIKRLTSELNAINKEEHPFGSREELNIQSKINDLKTWGEKTGSYFKSAKQRVKWAGATDYNNRRGIKYVENYLKVMEKYKGLENFDKLKDLLLKHSGNPDEFLKIVGKNINTLDLTYQSVEVYTQEEFNAFIEVLGVNVEEDIQTDTISVENKYINFKK